MTKAASKFARTKKSQPKSEPKMSPATRPMKRRLEDEILSDDEFESGDSRLDDESDHAADEDIEADLDLELDADLEAAGEKPTGDDDQIDDPIRIYLMQMGEIPAAQPGGRDRGRQADQERPPPFPPHHAGHRLRAARGDRHAQEHSRRPVAAGSHDRSLGDQHSREEAADEGPHAQPRRRWTTSWSRTARILPRRSTSTGPSKQRRAAWKRLIARRSRAVRLIEELGLRTQRLQPILEKLKQVSRQMEELHAQIRQLKGRPDLAPQRAALKKELCHLMKITLESPATLRRRIARINGLCSRVRSGQAAALGGQPAAGRLHRQALPQPRPELPRPHPGRQHRA